MYKKPDIWKTKLLKNIGEYKLNLWISQNQIEQLIRYSTDKKDIALLNWTSDFKRFSSKELFEKWYNDKDRYLFTLSLSDWQLVWIWWWRPSSIPTVSKTINNELSEQIKSNKNNIHTSAIRIYPKFRWKGLTKYIFESENFYREIFKNIYMCIDINKENIASQKSFEKIWYKFYWYWENKKAVESKQDIRMLYVKTLKETDKL